MGGAPESGGWEWAKGAPSLVGHRISVQQLCSWESYLKEGSSSPERTKQLLFQGAQTYRDHIWSEDCSVNHLRESLKSGVVGAPQPARGQMLIGPDGRLTRCQAQASEAGEWPPVRLACYNT